MVAPLNPLRFPVRKDVEVVTIRLPDGTTKKVTREEIEAQKRQEGEKK